MNVKIKVHAESKKFYDVNLRFWQLYLRDIMDEKKWNMGYEMQRLRDACD